MAPKRTWESQIAPKKDSFFEKESFFGPGPQGPPLLVAPSSQGLGRALPRPHRSLPWPRQGLARDWPGPCQGPPLLATQQPLPPLAWGQQPVVSRALLWPSAPAGLLGPVASQGHGLTQVQAGQAGPAGLLSPVASQGGRQPDSDLPGGPSWLVWLSSQPEAWPAQAGTACLLDPATICLLPSISLPSSSQQQPPAGSSRQQHADSMQQQHAAGTSRQAAAGSSSTFGTKQFFWYKQIFFDHFWLCVAFLVQNECVFEPK